MDSAVEVTGGAQAVLEREGKRLLISANDRDGLDFDLVCALCRGTGTTVYHGGSGLGEVRPCSLCSPKADE